MAQAGQKSERHSAYPRNGHRGDHQDERLQSLLQWRAGNQRNLHAHLPVRLPESQLLSVGFQLCGVGLTVNNMESLSQLARMVGIHLGMAILKAE